MFTAKRIETTVEPKKIDYLGDNSYYYNYDIQVSSREKQNIDSEENTVEYETVYSFVQVRLYGKAEYAKMVKAIIRAYIDQDEEFDLINSANRVTLGINESTEATDNYKQYLELVDTIKANVKKDLE
jgi:hypothetical protein